jgi:hypothetical protein
MSLGSPQTLRLVFKRVFAKYYLELQTPAIADPTEAFGACRSYLNGLRQQLGPEEFMVRLDDETTNLVAQVEQDLRHRQRGKTPQLSYDDLEDRVRECFEHALGWFDDVAAGIRVE